MTRSQHEIMSQVSILARSLADYAEQSADPMDDAAHFVQTRRIEIEVLTAVWNQNEQALLRLRKNSELARVNFAVNGNGAMMMYESTRIRCLDWLLGGPNDTWHNL